MMRCFKGIKAYYYIVEFVLVLQMFKLVHFVTAMELPCFVAVFLTTGLTIKLTVFDKKLKGAKYWLIIAFMLVQEVILGLDQLIPATHYTIAVISMLIAGICFSLCLDAPSVRKQMDNDAYILKTSCSVLIVVYAIATLDILTEYMYPHILM